ncbi:GerMN domain-containing protein [Flintibacter muris]|uniref:GerMN domain-containing protein n=1 Tax=Flintibacter muris TaxID=2941327 RepID=UPI00203A55DE|nr:GerMN domain-containing protein [Flintibacter muris]
MKARRWLPVLLVLLLLQAACGGRAEEPVEGPVLWFCSGGDREHGPALTAQPYQGEEPLEAEELLAALLAGPTQDGLTSPFPRGVTLQRCRWDEERPGILLVDLSEQYGALADISLTLADYSIVLTLSQLQGVEGIEITAGGRQVSYRSHQQLSSEEAVLWDELAEEADAS